MQGFEVTDALLIGLIISLVELAVRVGLPKRFAPVLAIVLGVAGGIVYIFPGDAKMGLLVGLMMGLASVGMYSSTKNVIGK